MIWRRIYVGKTHIATESGPLQPDYDDKISLVILQNITVHNFKIGYGETIQPYS